MITTDSQEKCEAKKMKMCMLQDSGKTILVTTSFHIDVCLPLVIGNNCKFFNKDRNRGKLNNFEIQNKGAMK